MRTRTFVATSVCLVVSLGAGFSAALAFDEGQLTLDVARKLVKQMEEQKCSLSAAIEAAEKHSKGTAIHAEAELENDVLELEVCCVVGDKVMECEVGAGCKVSEMEEESAQAAEKEHAAFKDVLKHLTEAKLNLGKVAADCAAQCKGHALEAVARLEKGELMIDVVALAGDKLMKCTHDKTGKQISSKELTPAAPGEKKGEKKEGATGG